MRSALSRCLAIEAFGRRSPSLSVSSLFGVSTYTTTWDVFLLPASLATSALVFGALLHARRPQGRARTASLLGAGVLFAWAVFLIPTVLGAFVLSLPCRGRRRPGRAGDRRRALRSGALFALPLVVAGGACGRAAEAARRGPSPGAIPRATTGLEEALNDFLRAWGGSVVHWDPRAEINWFEMRAPQNFRLPTQSNTPPFPGYIYTTAFGPADLVAIKVSIRDSLDQETVAGSDASGRTCSRETRELSGFRSVREAFRVFRCRSAAPTQPVSSAFGHLQPVLETDRGPGSFGVRLQGLDDAVVLVCAALWCGGRHARAGER